MNKPFGVKYILLFFLIITTTLTIYSRFIASDVHYSYPTNIDEKFDEELFSINTTEKLNLLVADHFKNNNHDTAKTVLFIDTFLRSRFYHSYSTFSWKDNWIAVLCGNFFWDHFLFPVVPSNIIEYPMAACSQQGLIFQEQLANLKIPCSTIRFFPLEQRKPGHYAVSVYYGSSWHFYDSNREPYIIDSTMPSIEKIIDEKLYEKMYSRPSNIEFQKFFENKSYERVNTVPYSKGKMYSFHTITSFLSGWLWCILLIAYLILAVSGKKARRLAVSH